MKVFLTGATGYVGRQVASDLLKAGYQVRALVRTGSEKKGALSEKGIEIVIGDVTDPGSLNEILVGCEAAIHLSAIIREYPKRGITFQRIIFEGTKNMVDLARKEGLRRFICISALGTSADALKGYSKAKYEAEDYVKKSGLAWTVFQPSIIFGKENEETNNFTMVLVNVLGKMPIFVPVIGNGKYIFQPIALENVSEAIVKCLIMPQTICKTYQVAGLEKLTYNQMLDVVGSAIGRSKPKLHVPLGPMKILTGLLGAYPFFPISQDQLTNLVDGSECSGGQEEVFFDEFLIKPISFKEGVMSSLSRDHGRTGASPSKALS